MADASQTWLVDPVTVEDNRSGTLSIAALQVWATRRHRLVVELLVS